VLGILCAVMGTLLTGMGVWSLLTAFDPNRIAVGMPGGAEDARAQQAVFERWRDWKTAEAVGVVGLALGMVGVGAGLLMRRGWSVGLGRTWAIAALLAAIGSAAGDWEFQRQSLAALAERHGGRPPPEALLYALSCGRIFFSGALPTVVLILLLRSTARSDVLNAGR
jgi:hypothetical protein